MYLNIKFCFLNLPQIYLSNGNSTMKSVFSSTLPHRHQNETELVWAPTTFVTVRKQPGLTIVLIKRYWQVKIEE